MDVRQYVPAQLLKLPFWDKYSEVVQHIVDEKIKDFADSIGKFSDRVNLSDEAYEEILYESGYSYITDILVLDNEGLRNLLAFTPLIHLLKGTRKGLELVLKLLGATAEIVEWWETIGDANELPPNSFSLTVQFAGGNDDQQMLIKFIDFISHYVYPLMYLDLGVVATTDVKVSVQGVTDLEDSGTIIVNL